MDTDQIELRMRCLELSVNSRPSVPALIDVPIETDVEFAPYDVIKEAQKFYDFATGASAHDEISAPVAASTQGVASIVITPEQEARIREFISETRREDNIRILPSASFDRSIGAASQFPAAVGPLKRTLRAGAIAVGCIAQAFRRQRQGRKLLVGSALPDGTFLRPGCQSRKGEAHDPEQ